MYYKLILLTLLFVFSACSYVEDSKSYDDNVFMLSDNLNDEEFSNFVSDKENLIALNNFIVELSNMDDLLIQFSNVQPLGLHTKGIDIDNYSNMSVVENSIHQYEHENKEFISVNAIVLNETAYELNELELTEGTIPSDVHINELENTTVPIVLGSNYEEYMEIGDTVILEYLMTTIEAEIVGFLAQDSEMITYNGPVHEMENYILFPKIEYTNEYIENNFVDQYSNNLPLVAKVTSNIHQLIVTTSNENKLEENLRQLENEYQFPNYQIDNINDMIN